MLLQNMLQSHLMTDTWDIRSKEPYLIEVNIRWPRRNHFLSSRVAGILEIKDSLLQELGDRLVPYDLPGFGESD
nr:putative hydrolase/acyltransferase [Tanacetum cinerariifolium]